MTKLADYDKYNYDYKDYWDNRSYEDLAERHLINNALEGIKGERFIDIGGSYGRLLDTYKNRFKQCVIIDYSFNTLQKYSKQILDLAPNCTLIAANAYFLPFKNNSFDGGMMVRVLHHISDIEKYSKELTRILSNKSIFLQELANKIHIKARLKALFKLDFKMFNETPYQQPSQGNFEGTEGEDSVFLNFHPKYIKRFLQKHFSSIIIKRGCSFLRMPSLKNLFSTKQLMSIEKLLQNTLSWTNIPPSIFYIIRLLKSNTENVLFGDTVEILACPKCKSDLYQGKNYFECKKCKTQYNIVDNIIDFRVKE